MKEIELSEKIHEEITHLLSLSDGYINSSVSAHEIERGLLKRLLKLGFVLLCYIFERRILGEEACRIVPKGCEKIVTKGKTSRNYLSIFGMLTLIRPSFWSEERGKMYIADESLQLPPDQNSYFIQELLGESASESDYRESVCVVNKVLDLGLSGKLSERNSRTLGILVEDFYSQHPIEEETSAVCFSGSFDGKGVPKIKDKVVINGEAVRDNPKKRLGKGEKRNVMQMATVSVTSSFTPKIRSRDNIIKGLIDSPLTKLKVENTPLEVVKNNDNRWHQGIHKRAFLADQHKAVEYGIKNIHDRMTHPDSRFVVPIDAGIGLEEKVLQSVKKYNLEAQFDGIILDIIHVSEYVWDAATAIFGEKSNDKYPLVKKMLEDLLDSKTQEVIKQLKKVITDTELSEHKNKQIQKTITYFENHQHNMDYKKFIEKGYPVSSALVEAACGHLVKERMEQSGMRWSSKGAQDILDLRAIKLNDHFQPFMEFVIQKQRKKNFAWAA
jgi:hypothetical protein